MVVEDGHGASGLTVRTVDWLSHVSMSAEKAVLSVTKD